MKNLLKIALGLWVVISIILGVVIWKHETKAADHIGVVEAQAAKIDRLEERLKFKRFGIMVGDSTLQVLTELIIQGEPYKYLHIERLKFGRNRYYYVLRENLAIDIIIDRYDGHKPGKLKLDN